MGYSLLLLLTFLSVPFVIWLVIKIKFKAEDIKIDDIINNIEASGELLFSQNCGGRIGFTNYSMGFLTIQIYTTGIIITPGVFGKRSYIMKDEIKEIQEWKGLFTKGNKIIYERNSYSRDIIIYANLDENIKTSLSSQTL
ncbi:MAG: hypothetical protein JXJ04_05260 [Spirochaetales bacterium]|nr:hypothetical protein [Spirochaetales bacterium]